MGEVQVRLARLDERRRWDALMDRHHYLGFRQFAGRGLRHVAMCAGTGWRWWVGSRGAFKCQARDRWLGWHRSVQLRRLHLIGNNARFLILSEASGIANLAAAGAGAQPAACERGLEAAHGHALEFAETFVDPSHFHGGAYDASNWVRVGGARRNSPATTTPIPTRTTWRRRYRLAGLAIRTTTPWLSPSSGCTRPR